MTMPYMVDKEGFKYECPMETRERPKCRKFLNKYCIDYEVSLKEVWLLMRDHQHVSSEGVNTCLWSRGLVSQCRKMLWEGYTHEK